MSDDLPARLRAALTTEAPDFYKLRALLREAAERIERDCRPIHYMRYRGVMDEAERQRAAGSPLCQMGDTVLVWVNEGDLYFSAATAVEPDAP